MWGPAASGTNFEIAQTHLTNHTFPSPCLQLVCGNLLVPAKPCENSKIVPGSSQSCHLRVIDFGALQGRCSGGSWEKYTTAAHGPPALQQRRCLRGEATWRCTRLGINLSPGQNQCAKARSTWPSSHSLNIAPLALILKSRLPYT